VRINWENAQSQNTALFKSARTVADFKSNEKQVSAKTMAVLFIAVAISIFRLSRFISTGVNCSSALHNHIRIVPETFPMPGSVCFRKPLHVPFD
jgi:hypothetical protein